MNSMMWFFLLNIFSPMDGFEQNRDFALVSDWALPKPIHFSRNLKPWCKATQEAGNIIANKYASTTKSRSANANYSFSTNQSKRIDPFTCKYNSLVRAIIKYS